MCRRELDKAESEIKKNSSIIGDYKQVGLCALDGAVFSGSPVCLDGLYPLHTPVLPGSATGTDKSLHWTSYFADSPLSSKGNDRCLSHCEHSVRSCWQSTWLRAQRISRHLVKPHRVLGSISYAGSGLTFTCARVASTSSLPGHSHLKNVTELVSSLLYQDLTLARESGKCLYGTDGFLQVQAKGCRGGTARGTCAHPSASILPAGVACGLLSSLCLA